MTEFEVDGPNGKPWRIGIRVDVIYGIERVVNPTEKTFDHEESLWWRRDIFAFEQGELAGYAKEF